jgi:dihydrofolate synthase/folylpolyglutamate synthase
MGRINYERTPKAPERACLERMERLAALLGNPQNELCIVHVAGSKGKGSAATMIAQILQAAGWKVGLFTSPHLTRLEERIAINNQPCPLQRFSQLVNQIAPVVESMDAVAQEHDSLCGPTYFEILTAVAWLQFAESAVDVAVMEVGLGGRLDSTNVCTPAVSVITSISRDHMRQLGNTHAEIAAEKAGIIKPNVPVVSGVICPIAAKVVSRVAHHCDCELLQLDCDFHYEIAVQGTERNSKPTDALRSWFNYRDRFGHRFDRLALSMLGNHQAANAAVAIATLVALGQCPTRENKVPKIHVDERSIRQGLIATRLPARVELLSFRADQPLVVIDGAHNGASVTALIQSLDCFVKHDRDSRRIRVVFGTTRGKDIDGMLHALTAWADEIVLTCYVENPRGAPVDQLQAVIDKLPGAPATIAVAENPLAAWQTLWQTALPRDLLCVTGSLFLAAELRARMLADLASAPTCLRVGP